MKKKKPKIPPPKPPSISPSKSPPSKTLPKSPLISAAQANPIDSDLTSSREAPKIVSDAQFSSRADAVAQQAVGAPDLALAPSIPPLSKTVIDDRSSDPSSTNINNQSMNLESISVASPPRTSVTDKVALVTVDAKMISLSSQLATNKAQAPYEMECFDAADAQHVPTDKNQINQLLESDKLAKISLSPVEAKLTSEVNQPPKDPSDTCCAHAKGLGKRLSKKGEAFTLPSGEACIKIPNSVIEKHRKSWEPFVLGQFYSDPPSQGTLHNIVNGIWSKQYRDIAVSKMEGFAFLFRIPNASTRHRVVNQRLW